MDLKIAVVCGAHTQLGKFVIRELLRHERIERVYALAEKDPRDDLSIHPSDYRKLVLEIDSFDQIEKLIADHVPDADLAFCCLGCGRAHLSSLGPFIFHRLNLDIPQRFVHEMFRLGAQHISILSDVAAASHRRPTEFHRVKGELNDRVKELYREAGPYAPAISLFNIPTLLTDMKDQNGIREQDTSKLDKVLQMTALKFDFKPSRAVHVRDVAKAMVADAFERLEFEDDSEYHDIIRKTHIRIAELDGPMIVYLANATRAVQRRTLWKKYDHNTVQKRVSLYAKQQGAFRDLEKLSDVEHSNDDPFENKHETQFPNEQHLHLSSHPTINNSNPVSRHTNDLSFDEDSLESSGIERFRSISYARDLANTENHARESNHDAPSPESSNPVYNPTAYQSSLQPAIHSSETGNTILSHSPSASRSQPLSPAPSPATNQSYVQSRESFIARSFRSSRTKSMSRSKSVGSLRQSPKKADRDATMSPPGTRIPTGSFQSQRRPRPINGHDANHHVGASAAALGEQIGRNLTDIHGNNVLPDVRQPTHIPSSSRKSQSARHQGQYMLKGPDESPIRRLQYNTNGLRSVHTNNNTNSLSSPPSGSLERAAFDVPLSPPRLPDGKRGKHLEQHQASGQDMKRQSMGSGYGRRESQSYMSRRSSGKSNSRRSNGFTNSEGRSPRAAQPGNVVSQLSILAGRVLAVTERPSTRRAREAVEAERMTRLRRESGGRGNEDIRAIGQTTI